MRRASIALATLVACSPAAGLPSMQAPTATNAPNEGAVAEAPVPQRPTLSDMVEVEGDYCPVVEETCVLWADWVNGELKTFHEPKPRCAEFVYPTRCLSKEKVHMHFLIDRYEWPNVKGQRPQSWMTWTDAARAMKADGKRLCTDEEWTFACEGPDMKPFPYGDGYHRSEDACNIDNPIGSTNVFLSKRPEDAMSRFLDSLLVPSGDVPMCESPFHVYDQVGNIDEWVVNRTGKPYSSHLKGGHVFGVRNACRPFTDAHNEQFSWYETGARACKDVP